MFAIVALASVGVAAAVTATQVTKGIFKKDSTATFGAQGPTIHACPWYRFDAQGEPLFPRGPSKVAVKCRSDTLDYYMEKFRNGESFIVVKDGTELSAHVGGSHNGANDMDLDAMSVEVHRPAGGSAMSQLSSIGTGSGEEGGEDRVAHFRGSGISQPSLNVGVSLGLARVRIKTSDPNNCMSAHGYGVKNLETGHVDLAWIEEKVCLCQADGVQTICDKTEEMSTLWQQGDSFWMPLPDSKNLGRVLETYIGLGDSYSSWRDSTVQDLLSWDADRNHRLSLGEVLQAAPKKGVSAQWLDAMYKDDPCVVVNGQISADMWLRVMENIAASPGELERKLTEAKVFPVNDRGNAAAYADSIKWLQKGYHAELLKDASACREALRSSGMSGPGGSP